MKIWSGPIILVCLTLVSCVSLKAPPRGDLIPLNTPGKIGRYPVQINREVMDKGKLLSHSTALWYYFKNKSDPDSLDLKQATHMELEIVDYKHLRAALYKGDSLLKTSLLKGKLKNGYFRRKAKLEFMGLPPIFWSVTSSKIQFGLGPGEELYIDSASETNGGFLMMLAGTPGLTYSLIVPSLK